MRTLLTAIFLLLIASLTASAQDKKQAPKKEEEEQTVFTKIEIEAQTDMKQWNRYIMKNLTVPDSSLAQSGMANLNVVVSFIVDQYGRMTDVKVEKDPGHGLGARIVKVVRNYPGTWTPSIQCGRAVKSYKRMPIKVCLSSSD
jgi:periplasmic protein TonB